MKYIEGKQAITKKKNNKSTKKPAAANAPDYNFGLHEETKDYTDASNIDQEYVNKLLGDFDLDQVIDRLLGLNEKSPGSSKSLPLADI